MQGAAIDKAPRPYKRQNAVREPDESAPQTTRNARQNAQNPRFKRQNPGSARNHMQKLNPIVKNAPISPQDAIHKYSALLTTFERGEILQFPEIYYLGLKSRKIEPNMANKYNVGYDDNSSNYKINVGDHLAYRFEILAVFGAGAFGQVLKCFDHKLRKKIAVKVIVSTEQMHEQGQIEAKILAKLNKTNSQYIVKAFDFFIFRSHICITYEILGKNLYEISQANNFRPLPIRNIRNYAIEILKGLEECHNLGIVHCDLKPENVLVLQDNNYHVKLIDFGSSCFQNHQKYEYIQSRFYRAPEVMIGIPYGPPMDVWSFALIIAEILIGKPLFPGDNELEELAMISEVIGFPDVSLVKKGRRKKEFFDDRFQLKQTRHTRGRKPNSITLKEALNSNDELFCDFMSKCLTWDQNERITVAEALQHPWINSKVIEIKANKSHGGLPILRSQE